MIQRSQSMSRRHHEKKHTNHEALAHLCWALYCLTLSPFSSFSWSSNTRLILSTHARLTSAVGEVMVWTSLRPCRHTSNLRSSPFTDSVNPTCDIWKFDRVNTRLKLQLCDLQRCHYMLWMIRTYKKYMRESIL